MKRSTRLLLGLGVLTLVGYAQSEFAQTAMAATLPATDYQDIRKLDEAKLFAPCPTDTLLLRFAESPKYKVQICSKEGDLTLPGYYMGNAKEGNGKIKFKITDRAAAQQGVYKNADYSYVIYTDGLHRDGFRPKLQVFGPKAKLLMEEQLISLYDKDFRPLKNPPKAAKSTINVVSMLPKIKGTKIPIFLPKPFTLEHGYEGKVYLFAASDANSYSVSLAAAPDCGGANACSIGFIGGERVKPGTELPFKTIVPLADGIEGSFKPLTCGASCSPPEMVWIQDNVMYSIQLKGVAPRTDDEALKAGLVKIANSAIQAGAR